MTKSTPGIGCKNSSCRHSFKPDRLPLGKVCPIPTELPFVLLQSGVKVKFQRSRGRLWGPYIGEVREVEACKGTAYQGPHGKSGLS